YVAPRELESILFKHDAVLDAAATGHFSEKEATEVPIAFKSQVLAEKIQSFVNEKVEPHKKLRGGVRFIHRIPKIEAGKTLRRVLKEQLKNDKMI
ncbi:hypothetical protein C2G38_1963034, partial [Gigaspora rosea]